MRQQVFKILMVILGMAVLLVGCTANGPETPVADDGHEHSHDEPDDHGSDNTDSADHDISMLFWPDLTPPDLDGGKLRVVATTSIIGDVVANVGGNAIELTTLMPSGQDPHSYEPSAQALTAVADAHVIIVNGWDLEEGLITNLKNIAGDTPLVPISARILPITLGEQHEAEDDHEEHGVDPHTWLDPRNVVQWVSNLKIVFGDLDPVNADKYDANADTYRARLADLIASYDQQIGLIPADERLLVTNHDALGYLAQGYGFEVIGTVIPTASTLAEPSASGLTALVAAMTRAGTCTIFTETTANDDLAQAAAAELTQCQAVAVVPLYTGALGLANSGAETYIEMMEANLAAITAVFP